MRTVPRHAGDAVVTAVPDEESTGTWKLCRSVHSLRHGVALIDGSQDVLNVTSRWLGHASVRVTIWIYLPIVGSDYGMKPCSCRA